MLLAKEQSLPILNVLGLTQPALAGLELPTYRLLSESTATWLRQPVKYMYEVSNTAVRCNNHFTNFMPITLGVKQGDNLSTNLFTFLLMRF
jgi:hypothetical protein